MRSLTCLAVCDVEQLLWRSACKDLYVKNIARVSHMVAGTWYLPAESSCVTAVGSRSSFLRNSLIRLIDTYACNEKDFTSWPVLLVLTSNIYNEKDFTSWPVVLFLTSSIYNEKDFTSWPVVSVFDQQYLQAQR